MTIRQILGLFFTVMVSALAIMLVLFALFFDQLTVTFNARLPEQAPTAAILNTPASANSAASSPTGQASVSVPTEAVTAPPQPAEEDTNPLGDDLPPLDDTDSIGLGVPVTAEETGPVAPPVPQAPTANDVAPGPTLYRVYVAGFASRADAEAALSRYRANQFTPVLVPRGSGVIIQLGVFSSAQRAQQLAEQTGAAIETL